MNHDQPWCSVEVDSNGNHIMGKWGNCGPYCDLGKIALRLEYVVGFTISIM